MAPDTTTVTIPTAAVVDRFLDRIAAGRGAELAELFTRDGVLAATVPNWRFTVRGAAAGATEFARWYTHPGRFEELNRSPLPGGESRALPTQLGGQRRAPCGPPLPRAPRRARWAHQPGVVRRPVGRRAAGRDGSGGQCWLRWCL